MSEKKENNATVSEDLTVTQKALDEIKKIMSENKIPETYSLRVGIKGGGCSGYTYSLGFDGDTNPTDNVFEFDGVKIIVDMKSYFYLTGTEIDYLDGLNGRGFVFNNPNAKRTCGCGSSFGA